VNIPRKEYYKLEDEYAKAIERNPELKDYFPHYEEGKFKPSRQYFWEVWHTLEPEYV
jgi:hypothetical protein